MKVCTIVPNGWPCMLSECPPGPFIDPLFLDSLCFKSEYYTDDGRVQADNSAGEFFHGSDGGATIVQPVAMVVEEVEP